MSVGKPLSARYVRQVPAPRKPPHERDASPEGFVSMQLRLAPDLVEQLDAWVDELQSKQPGFRLTRTGLVRDIVIKALQERGR
jgi:hypothetical protein